MKEIVAGRSIAHRDQLHNRYSETAGVSAPAPVTDRWREDFRDPFQQDRDRILYSAAFQRLAYVTQVTASESGLTFHNRLSHSLKVAQVGRRNAERLRSLAEEDVITGKARALVESLSADAVEASCLAHDLGHPPFGHIAEEALQECAAAEQVLDRFEGNAQSFRIVNQLAQRASASGLDLTRQTLDGLTKYPWRHWDPDPSPKKKRERKWGYYDEDKKFFDWMRTHNPDPDRDEDLPARSLEAAIMEWADDLTYAVHDVEDFFRAGLIPLERLGEDPNSDERKNLITLLRQAEAETPGAFDAPVDELIAIADSFLPRYVVSSPYRHTRTDRRELKRRSSRLITDYLSAFRVVNVPRGQVAVEIEDGIRTEVALLNALVRVYVIRRPGLAVVQHGQQRVIKDLFKFYLDASAEEGGDRRLFPDGIRSLLDEELHIPHERRVRIVIDLISGLTEESAIQLHRRLVGGSAAPTLDATAQMA